MDFITPICVVLCGIDAAASLVKKNCENARQEKLERKLQNLRKKAEGYQNRLQWVSEKAALLTTGLQNDLNRYMQTEGESSGKLASGELSVMIEELEESVTYIGEWISHACHMINTELRLSRVGDVHFLVLVESEMNWEDAAKYGWKVESLDEGACFHLKMDDINIWCEKLSGMNTGDWRRRIFNKRIAVVLGISHTPSGEKSVTIMNPLYYGLSNISRLHKDTRSKMEARARDFELPLECEQCVSESELYECAMNVMDYKRGSAGIAGSSVMNMPMLRICANVSCPRESAVDVIGDLVSIFTEIDVGRVRVKMHRNVSDLQYMIEPFRHRLAWLLSKERGSQPCVNVEKMEVGCTELQLDINLRLYQVHQLINMGVLGLLGDDYAGVLIADGLQEDYQDSQAASLFNLNHQPAFSVRCVSPFSLEQLLQDDSEKALGYGRLDEESIGSICFLAARRLCPVGIGLSADGRTILLEDKDLPKEERIKKFRIVKLPSNISADRRKKLARYHELNGKMCKSLTTLLVVAKDMGNEDINVLLDYSSENCFLVPCPSQRVRIERLLNQNVEPIEVESNPCGGQISNSE